MRSIPLLSISIAVVFAATNLASAQEVKWRHDYAAARKEAAETGRPLLLDLGYEGCIWCRKLEATTFRDPAVAKTLNERFVPVKIDIQRDSRIPQALGITGYPTILVASPQGTVLGRQEGFADVAQMTALLNKAPPPAPGEATPAAATAKPEATLTPNRSAAREMLDQARECHDASRYAESLRLCRELIATYPSSSEADSARLLTDLVANDASAQRILKEQIQANLDTLKPKLTAALE